VRVATAGSSELDLVPEIAAELKDLAGRGNSMGDITADCGYSLRVAGNWAHWVRGGAWCRTSWGSPSSTCSWTRSSSLSGPGHQRILARCLCTGSLGREHLLHLGVGNKGPEQCWADRCRYVVVRGLRRLMRRCAPPEPPLSVRLT
jgi:hypothetical protein